MAKKQEITISSIVKRSTGLVSSNLDGELVMMSIENGEYYGLDAVGTRIWELIEKPISIERLIHILTEEFDITPGQCESDVMEFLQSLNDKYLIIIQ
jgi:hypothetical protein